MGAPEAGVRAYLQRSPRAPRDVGPRCALGSLSGRHGSGREHQDARVSDRTRPRDTETGLTPGSGACSLAPARSDRRAVGDLERTASRQLPAHQWFTPTPPPATPRLPDGRSAAGGDAAQLETVVRAEPCEVAPRQAVCAGRRQAVVGAALHRAQPTSASRLQYGRCGGTAPSSGTHFLESLDLRCRRRRRRYRPGPVGDRLGVLATK